MGGLQELESPARRFQLRRTVLWALGLVSAALFYPLARFISYTIKPKPRFVTVNKPLAPGQFHTDREFILFVEQEGVMALSRRCTHLGCRVAFREELGLIECPCHQSRFTREGVRTAGPAEKNLPRFPVKVQESPNGKVTGYVVQL
jgi:cytochrome b6-f complex iron-sulfur subunit